MVDKTVTPGSDKSQDAKTFSIRPLRPEDSPGIKQLLSQVGESGPVETLMQITVEDVKQGWEAISPGNFSLVAYAGAETNLVGHVSAWPHLATIGDTQEVKQVVRVNGFNIRQDYQDSSLGLSLVEALLSWVKATYCQPDIAVYACIQKVDTSIRQILARTGGTVTDRQLVLIPLKTLTTGAKRAIPSLNVTVREARLEDLEQVSSELNNFYNGYDLYTPQTAQSLIEWLSPKTLDNRPPENLARYYVAENSAGKLIGGVGVFNTPSIYNIKVSKVAPTIKFLNAFLKILPADGYLSSLLVSRVWYNQAYLAEARYLWQQVRLQESQFGKTLVVSYDIKSPLKAFYNPPKMYPKSKMQLLLFNQPEDRRLMEDNNFLATYES